MIKYKVIAVAYRNVEETIIKRINKYSVRDIFSSADLESDINMGSDENNYEFVYWVTIEGENPGLLQPGMKARIGFIEKDAEDISVEDSLKIQWIR